MITTDTALDACRMAVTPLSVETCLTVSALGRVLASAVTYEDDLPRFDQSAMDGYAIRSSDVAEASTQNAVRLPFRAVAAAGPQMTRPVLEAGHGMRIFTGAPIPDGADSVIPQERVSVENGSLVFTAPWPARRNIRWRGEEAVAGTPMAAKGMRIGPGLLAALVNASVSHVHVFRQPRIRLLVTGNELRESGSTLKFGEIVDSNGPLVRALLQRWGYTPPPSIRVQDDPDQIHRVIAGMLDEADLVLTCGGTSVGEFDFVPAAADSLGVRQVFWKVAQKPGKPVFLGIRERTALLALPGNPGAVLVNLLLHARMLLDRMEGVSDPGPTWSMAILDDEVERDLRREQLLRVRHYHDQGGSAHLHVQPQQGSHMLGNLCNSNALARIPAGEGCVRPGSLLQWTSIPT